MSDRAIVSEWVMQPGTGKAIELRPGDLAAGIALDRRGYLYVAINTFSVETNDIRVMTSPGRLAVIDTKTGVEVSRRNFGPKLSNFPFAVAALRDGSRVFVTSQRDGTVTVLDARDPAAIEELAVLKTGSHPVSLCLNSAQTRLYVANVV